MLDYYIILLYYIYILYDASNCKCRLWICVCVYFNNFHYIICVKTNNIYIIERVCACVCVRAENVI